MSNEIEVQVPDHPRPPEIQVISVLKDIGTILSDGVRGQEGLLTIERGKAVDQLIQKGHVKAAIEWGIYVGIERHFFRTGTVSVKQTVETSRFTVAARPIIVELPTLTATPEYWVEWERNSFEPHSKEVILLIHGIRTFANWQPMVQRVLEEIPNTTVVPIKYGYLDALRFWFPLFTRTFSVQDVRREIQNARKMNPGAQLSIIAHSFGTYAISQILIENPDLELNRLILSGSIIPRTFRWDYVRERIRHDVINDYGTRDIWPVLAKCLSWGYGDTGRHGFGRGATVKDRGHNYSHSEFFNEEFVKTYWKPWFESNSYVPSKWNEVVTPPSIGLGLLSILPLQWIIITVITCLLVWITWWSSQHSANAKPTVPQASATSPPSTKNDMDTNGTTANHKVDSNKVTEKSPTQKNDSTVREDQAIRAFNTEISKTVSEKSFSGEESMREGKRNAVGIVNVTGHERKVTGKTGQAEIVNRKEGNMIYADVKLPFSGNYDAKNFIGVLAEYRTDPKNCSGIAAFTVIQDGSRVQIKDISFKSLSPDNHDASRMATEAVRKDVMIKLQKN